MTKHLPITVQPRAFSLIEVVIAIGIISFCLVGMLSLLTAATQVGQESVTKTDNSLLFAKVISQLKVKPYDKVQDPDAADPAVYPLPSLGPVDADHDGKLDDGWSNIPSIFLVDDLNRYAGDPANAAERAAASKVVKVSVLDAQDLEITSMQDPQPAANGQIAFVRVEIFSPAAAFRSAEDSFPFEEKKIAQLSDRIMRFETEISPLEQ